MKEIKMYSLDEVASILQVTRRTMYNYVKNGKINAVKIGKHWRVSEKDLKAFLSKGFLPAPKGSMKEASASSERE